LPASGAPPHRSPCPIAQALDLLGDRWTLLVVRDLLLLDKHRFGDFLRSPESIPSNILAERLRRLAAADLVERRQYQAHPPRYEYHPTARGAELFEVLRALISWANVHLPEAARPPEHLLAAAAKRLAGVKRPGADHDAGP
jgi:DNA-binding HxlR family transcriptional regulator